MADTAVYDMVLTINRWKHQAEQDGCLLTKAVMSLHDEEQCMKGLATMAEADQWQLDSKLGLVICGVQVCFKRLPKYKCLLVIKDKGHK